MKKNLLIAFLLITNAAFSQSESANWYFGVHAGLNFFTGSPVVILSPNITTNEGCSSISDGSGNLLFYTDGNTVWNKIQQAMPNGTGLLGGSSSTQAALIVPQPGSTTLYYIFTTDEFGGPNGCRYSVVDMSLQGGNGDVTAAKNILIQNNMTEKLTAVKQANGVDYWIAFHEWGSNAFYIYSLTSSGFQAIPVISNSGMVHSTSMNQNTYGQMKFSFCGDRLALAAGYLDTVEIFNFDNTTGIVSNSISLPLFSHVYGIEFSPDQHLLYVSNYDPSATLVQFDITSGNPVTILASKTILSMTPDIYGLQMASDGKIYVCRSFSSFLGVINDPSVIGTGCNYVDNGVDLDPNFMGNTSALGLPGFVQSEFRLESACSTNSINEFNSENTTTVFPNPFENNFVIQLSELNHPSEIFIYDAIGKLIGLFSIAGEQKSFSFGKSVAPGIYFVFLKNKAGSDVIKVVKTGNK